MNTKHLLIVNGFQFRNDRTPDPEFIARLDKAVELIHQEYLDKSDTSKIDTVIISGGLTRKGCPSEAQFGEDYIKRLILGHDIPIFKEENSHTTIENIKFTKILVNQDLKIDSDNIDKITVVTTTGRLQRLKYLYNKLWPEVQNKIEFIVADHPQSPLLPLLEFLYLIYSKIDTNEKVLIRLTKKIFRNGSFN